MIKKKAIKLEERKGLLNQKLYVHTESFGIPEILLAFTLIAEC
jgi:hypothetical protein